MTEVADRMASPMTVTESSETTEAPIRPATGWRSVALVVAVLVLGLGGAFLGHRLVPAVGVLTWSIGLGVVAANIGICRATASRRWPSSPRSSFAWASSCSASRCPSARSPRSACRSSPSSP